MDSKQPDGSQGPSQRIPKELLKSTLCADSAAPSLQGMRPVYPQLSMRSLEERGERERETSGESKSPSVCLSAPRNEIQAAKLGKSVPSGSLQPDTFW